MSKWVPIALLTAGMGFTAGYWLNRPESPSTPILNQPDQDDAIAAALQRARDENAAANQAQDEKLQTALEQLHQSTESIKLLNESIAHLTRQNQSLTDELKLLQTKFTDPNFIHPNANLAAKTDAQATTSEINTATIDKKAQEKINFSQEILVFMTKTGKKYHRADCPSLLKSKIPLTLSEAKTRGYEPCARCKPPGD